jgi:hypothetical protein
MSLGAPRGAYWHIFSKVMGRQSGTPALVLFRSDFEIFVSEAR